MTYVFIHRWWTKKMMKDQGRFDQSTWDIRNHTTRTVMRWRMTHRGRRGCSGRELTTSTRFYCIELIDDGSFLCLTFTYEQNLIRIYLHGVCNTTHQRSFVFTIRRRDGGFLFLYPVQESMPSGNLLSQISQLFPILL